MKDETMKKTKIGDRITVSLDGIRNSPEFKQTVETALRNNPENKCPFCKIYYASHRELRTHLEHGCRA